MPRLAIHSAVSRSSSDDGPQGVERADHHPHRAAEQHGAGERADAQQVERQALRRDGSAVVGDARELRSDERQGDDGAAGDDEERRRDAERPDEQGGDGRAGGEAADLGGEQPPEVVPEALGVGEDDDAPHRRHGHADADAHHEAPDEQRHERAGDGQQEEAGDVEHHADEHEAPGVAAVGERGDEDLGEEPGEEADADDRAERAPR